MPRITVALTILLVTCSASADCLDPFKEPISRTENSVTVNSLPDSTALCISRPTSFCKECEPGYVHECRDGRWYANKENACGKDRASDRSTVPSNPVTKQGRVIDDTTKRQGDGVSEAAIVFHGAIIACGGGAPLDAVHRSLANRNDPLWDGPPPETAADILKLTNAHNDLDQEVLEKCLKEAHQDCTHLEERADRSACLLREVAKRN